MKIYSTLSFLLFLLSTAVDGQQTLTGEYHGKIKSDSVFIFVDEISGSSINGRIKDADGLFFFEGSVNGNEIQSARIHREKQYQNFRGRFLSDRLSLTFDLFDEVNLEHKQATTEFVKINRTSIDVITDTFKMGSGGEGPPVQKGKSVITFEHDPRLVGLWESISKHSNPKPPVATSETRTLHIFFADGGCGSRTGKPYRPGSIDTSKFQVSIPDRDSTLSWYSTNNTLIFFEKSNPLKPIYKVKYQFVGETLYFINQNGSTVKLNRREKN